MKQALRIFIFFFFLTALFSCKDKRWEVPASDSGYHPQLHRFELDFFTLGADGLDSADYQLLHQKYPNMLDLYIEGVLNMKPWMSKTSQFEINQLLANSDIKALVKDVKTRFPESSLGRERDEIEAAFQRFAFHFPDKTLPELYTLISLFAYNVIVDEGILGISLDMYQGGNYSLYPSTNIPKYRFKNFEPDYLVSDAIKAYLIAEFDEGGGQNLLEQMIFYGKIAYLQAAFLPELQEHILFNYSEDELSWCEENEAEIWFHFVDMELLYSNETSQIRKYLDDAPFIPGFPEGSSARVGKWIGYQIVKEYMDKEQDLSLKELMEEKDAGSILIKSKYKPRR